LGILVLYRGIKVSEDKRILEGFKNLDGQKEVVKQVKTEKENIVVGNLRCCRFKLK
jgi:hypothetical protein